MKVLYFEPFSGASGDMILGALVDIGFNFEKIKCFLESKLNIKIDIQKILKNGIFSTKITVIDYDNKNNKTYNELVDIILNLNLDKNIEQDVLSIFKILGMAEAKVHGVTNLDLLHFHEIGQNDALVDIIGTCFALNEIKQKYDIKIGSIICDSINIGNGHFTCIHGIYSIPAPATLEILKNTKLLFYNGKNNGELLTPTGIALLSYFTLNTNITCEKYKTILKQIIKIGYGSGTLDLITSNVLRVSICDIKYNNSNNSSSNLILNSKFEIDKENQDNIEILETNIDNCTGEVLGSLINKLIICGAKDACIIPLIMKKGRPGYLLKVIVTQEKSFDLAKIIMIETGTLGIRVIEVKHRIIANRIFKNIIYI